MVMDIKLLNHSLPDVRITVDDDHVHFFQGMGRKKIEVILPVSIWYSVDTGIRKLIDKNKTDRSQKNDKANL